MKMSDRLLIISGLGLIEFGLWVAFGPRVLWGVSAISVGVFFTAAGIGSYNRGEEL